MVAIGAVRESKIITHAQDAGGRYNQAQVNETSALQWYDNYIKEQTEPKSTWEYAWVCRNGVWDEESITNQEELPSGENIVVANFYRTEQKITPNDEEMSGIVCKEGYAYKLVIEGNGEMGLLADVMSEEPNVNAWMKVMPEELNKEEEELRDFVMAYVTDVVISEGVTSIGAGAFMYGISLKNISMPNSLISIEYYSMFGCTALTNITIPGNVEQIGPGAFLACTSMASINIPEKVKEIPEGAFSLCVSLENIIIPSTVTRIGESAFYRCGLLSGITIPSTVTEIGEEAFDDIDIIYYDGPATGSPWGAGSVLTSQ